MTGRTLALRSALLIALGGVAAGCAAAAAGAGAAAAIAYNERGVSSKVGGAPAQVFQRSQAVFRELGITETGHEMGDDGVEHELKGRRGDLEITVDIKQDSENLTSVEVFAQESPVEWDREYAREVLEAIIARS
jgi:hypothetical protein